MRFFHIRPWILEGHDSDVSLISPPSNYPSHWFLAFLHGERL